MGRPAVGFSLEELIDGSRAALATADPPARIGELLRELLREPARVVAAFESIGASQRADAPRAAEAAFRDTTLRITRVAVPPGFVSAPHSHGCWAVIGVYAGRENNRIWERSGGSIAMTRGRDLAHPDVLILPEKSTIHSIANPGVATSHAIHVYGGVDAEDRRMWHPASLEERPIDSSLFYRWSDEAPPDYVVRHGVATSGGKSA